MTFIPEIVLFKILVVFPENNLNNNFYLFYLNSNFMLVFVQSNLMLNLGC